MSKPLKLLPTNLDRVRVDRGVDSPTDAGELEITRHVFDKETIASVNGALAARRPLLVRGEPGVGKTQLAAAVAAYLDRPLVSFTVNSRTESSDLLWKFDAVQRLAEAQLCGASRTIEVESRERLEEWRFITPGPLWWGFHWNDALAHMQKRIDKKVRDKRTLQPDSGGDPSNGVVVLIDEIDKADTDVPNGLLEALGSRRFTPLGCSQVEAQEPMPLVIITTNQERILPDAFIRRCLVRLVPPPERSDLIARGQAHFGDKFQTVLELAADQLMEDRANSVPPRPGLAEYLDLVRAVLTLAKQQSRDEKELIRELAEFTFRKQSGGRK